MPTDPVCGMFVPESSSLKVEKDGETYYFCSKGCMDKFVSPEAESGKLKKKMVVAWSLTIPILILQYIVRIPPWTQYTQMVLAVPVIFYSGSGFLTGAYHSIRERTGNMDLLVTIGAMTAFFFSIFVTIFPSYIPGSSPYFDASTFIVTLILTGGFIESLTKTKASASTRSLRKLLPSVVHLCDAQGNVTDTDIEKIKVGDEIILKPGETIPADGVVTDGKSEIDQSVITGEQYPILVTVGMKVSSGTLNLNGVLKVKVEAVGRNSTVNKIYDLVQKASMGRMKVQRIADIFSSFFIPVVLTVSISSGLFWYFYLSSYGNTLAPEISILAFVSVMVIACPCAIGLAGPITLLISAMSSMERGMLITNSGALERIAKATRAVFDKTGTLTFPFPEISSVTVENGYSENDVIQKAFSLEKYSNHPVAAAISKYAKDKGIGALPVSNFRETPGEGVSGKVGNDSVTVRKNSDGGQGIEIMINGVLASRSSIQYDIREEAPLTVKTLTKLGLKVSMVTGDTYGEAKRIGDITGIHEIHSDVKPEEKAEIVRKYQEDGDYVIFIGDGINDSIALETADAGIALGSGMDFAKSSGDLILLRNNLMDIASAILISRATISKVRQNIGWAIGYNAALIPVAAGVLVPVFGLTIFSILPILAALAMGMSSTSVVLNSLRLRRRIRVSISSVRGKSGVVITPGI